MNATPTETTFLYVFSYAPYSHAAGQEGLDAALLAASFDCAVSVLFLHDGVFQLLAGQSTRGTPLKQYTKAFGALNDFEIEQVYVHDLSLQARGIEPAQLIAEVEVLSTEQISSLINAQQRVFTF